MRKNERARARARDTRRSIIRERERERGRKTDRESVRERRTYIDRWRIQEQETKIGTDITLKKDTKKKKNDKVIERKTEKEGRK